MPEETDLPPEGTPTAAPDPGPGGQGPVAGGNGPPLRAIHEQVLADHAGGRVGGRFAPGSAPWNKGRRVAVAPDSSPLPGPNSALGHTVGDSAPVAPVDPETVRRLLELGLTALDDTLKTNFVLGWERVSGDRAFAEQQAESYALKDAQKEAIAIAAGLVAEKYAVDLQFLPETALAVAVAGYALPWMVAFRTLKKAAKLKAAASAN